MEYDSSSSREDRLKDLEASAELSRAGGSRDGERDDQPRSGVFQWYTARSTRREERPNAPERTLSAQVMDYYHKYSQSSSLGRYFSSAEIEAATNGGNYCTRARSIVDVANGPESYIALSSEERFRIESAAPRERRRWARPPLIGQPSDTQNATSYVSTGSRSPSPVSKRPATSTIPEERNESRENLPEVKDSEIKATSPTSSVASHKPLEWDSGADVGYYCALPRFKEKDKKLCTIERMALARGCSAALRLDPEGTNESSCSRKSQKHAMKPDANSTPLVGAHPSGESESEIEITPIMKNHRSVVITGREVELAEVCCKGGKTDDGETSKPEKTPLAPLPIKYPTEGSRTTKSQDLESAPLKKSSSMNLLQFPLSRLSLKRSQSELNLRAKEKKNIHALPPLIFDSTSSIATVVNRPPTLDKFIQTSLDTFSQGIQVSPLDVESDDEQRDADRVDRDEVGAKNVHEKSEESDREPPLPKRASSLAPKSRQSILKNTNTYDVRGRGGNRANSGSELSENSTRSRRGEKSPRSGDKTDDEASGKTETSSTDTSKNSASAPEDPADETAGENATGRASNSFEYFPGHVYQNVPGGSTSRVSSVDTGRESRGSTMPNTSSSIDEKLWGDSDNLVRDLERSVNILKSLVDANKCDKQVKKRLIHHVIKRLVTAKYTDDMIDRELDENVPWNPADARKKIYRNEIIQALTRKHNTTDSSAEDWLPRKRNIRGNSASPKKVSKELRAMKEIIDSGTSPPSTENSDKFPSDCHTDRTVMDGRKARMGLRSEDRRRESRNDRDKSESSECFVPSAHGQAPYKIEATTAFYSVDKPSDKLPRTSVAMASATTTSGAASNGNRITERIVLVKDRTRTESNETDWRLPTTMSERRFEMGRRSNSESGDAKLINYAAMEKRNQLVWITNEISHLCNLKRLLEESNKSEGGGRAADPTRKKITSATSGQWILEDDSTPEMEILARGKSSKKLEDNQWSSHGNLARGESGRRTADKVGHTRKRNSCTQTGNDGGPSGHSRTGGEIVLATIPISITASNSGVDRDKAENTREASVQTVASSPRNQKRIGTNADKKIHENQRHVCYCQRYAAHSRHAACIVHSPARCAKHDKNLTRSSHKREERPIITQPTRTNCNAKSVDSRKEAKNQMNANCKSNWAVRELPVKKNRCVRCEVVDEVPKADGAAKSIAENGQKSRKAEIENCDCPGEHNRATRQKRTSTTEKSSAKVAEEVDTAGYSASASEADDARCTCDLEDDSRRKNRAKSLDREAETNDSDENVTSEESCKSCRTCGTVWKSRDGKVANRRCQCSQDYLKPVAYELKFDEAKERSSKKNGNKPAIRGTDTSEKKKNRTKGSQSIPNSARTRSKCPCDEVEVAQDSEKEARKIENEDEEHPDTLKEFLTTNKPEFFDGAETRRRYMTEISELRQLKMEKRKQYLAMAGTSAFMKPQRSPKSSTANAQKKISDYEMKLRLRMRYLRLNEVRNKRRQREKEEEARRNHLMAKLFGQKLQQKVLKGQVDLSQSVSVISNL